MIKKRVKRQIHMPCKAVFLIWLIFQLILSMHGRHCIASSLFRNKWDVHTAEAQLYSANPLDFYALVWPNRLVLLGPRPILRDLVVLHLVSIFSIRPSRALLEESAFRHRWSDQADKNYEVVICCVQFGRSLICCFLCLHYLDFVVFFLKSQ